MAKKSKRKVCYYYSCSALKSKSTNWTHKRPNTSQRHFFSPFSPTIPKKSLHGIVPNLLYFYYLQINVKIY